MKHREGASLFFIPLDHKPCKVVHVTPYHENDDPHAFVTVQFPDGNLCNVPVAIQDEYLATEGRLQRPALQPVVRNKNILQRLFGKQEMPK